jgi:hypothetical protein
MSLNKNVSLYVSNVPLHDSSNNNTEPPPNCNNEDSSEDIHEDESTPEDNPHRKVRRLGEGTGATKSTTTESSSSVTTTTTTTTGLGETAAAASAVLDECPSELKTLRYKIMLMNNNTPVDVPPPAKNSYENLQLFLEKEKNNNNKENWNKLNRSVKNKKVSEFVENYATANELTEEEHTRLLEMLKQNMGKGKLTKNKEVIYDKTKGVIKEMPCLVFNKVTRHFTIKNMDAAAKHSGTIKKSYLGKSGTGTGGGGGGSATIR